MTQQWEVTFIAGNSLQSFSINVSITKVTELRSATECRCKVSPVCLLNITIRFQFPRCSTAKSLQGKAKILFTEDPKLLLYQIVLYLQAESGFPAETQQCLIFLLLSLWVWPHDFKSQPIKMGDFTAKSTQGWGLCNVN